MFLHLIKALFSWVVACILSAKTIMAAVHSSFSGGAGNEQQPMWTTLILLLCLSGPFVLRANKRGFRGLEGALWLVFTALFIVLLKVSNSMVLEAMCWKVLGIEDDYPSGCTIGVGGFLWGLYGVFLVSYHFPENIW